MLQTNFRSIVSPPIYKKYRKLHKNAILSFTFVSTTTKWLHGNNAIMLFSGVSHSVFSVCFCLSTPIKSGARPSTTTALPFTLPSLCMVYTITHRQMVWVWVLPPHANIRDVLNLSHILMDGRADREYANCRAVPLASSVYYRIYLTGFKEWGKLAPVRRRQRKWDGWELSDETCCFDC